MIEVKLTEKDATTKKQMACSNRKVYRLTELNKFKLTKTAGFIHTGEYSEFTLIVLDFDLPPELKGKGHLVDSYDWFKRFNDTKPYMKVLTPSCGIHLYYIFKKGFKYDNKAKLKTFDDHVVCDIRGHNGIIFAPGSAFTDEVFTSQYTLMNKNYDLVIHEDIDSILDVFGIGVTEHQTTIQNSGKNTTKTFFTNSYDNDESYFKSCDLWASLYRGLFEIYHGSFCGVPEFLIWKNLWLWIYHNKINFDIAKSQLQRVQPAYNSEETELQLRYVDFSYRPSRKIGRHLLNRYIENIKIGDVLNELYIIQ